MPEIRVKVPLEYKVQAEGIFFGWERYACTDGIVFWREIDDTVNRTLRQIEQARLPCVVHLEAVARGWPEILEIRVPKRDRTACVVINAIARKPASVVKCGRRGKLIVTNAENIRAFYALEEELQHRFNMSAEL